MNPLLLEELKNPRHYAKEWLQLTLPPTFLCRRCSFYCPQFHPPKRLPPAISFNEFQQILSMTIRQRVGNNATWKVQLLYHLDHFQNAIIGSALRMCKVEWENKPHVGEQKSKRGKKQEQTGVSADGTLRASMLPHRYPRCISHPCKRTLTFQASSFCELDTFCVPANACIMCRN